MWRYGSRIRLAVAIGFAVALVVPAVAVGDAASTGLRQLAGRAGCVTPTGGTCSKAIALVSPDGVAIATNGRTAYVWGGLSGPGAVAVFSRTRSGRLQQLGGKAACVRRFTRRCRSGRALETPSSVALSPDGRHAYITGEKSWSIAAYRRGRNGALSELAGASGCLSSLAATGNCRAARGLAHATDAAVSPDGRNVYVAGDGLAIFVRSKKTGVLAQLPGAVGCFMPRAARSCAAANGFNAHATSVAVSRDGRSVYAVAGTGLHGVLLAFARDRATGALTQYPGVTGCLSYRSETPGCGFARSLAQPAGVAVAPDGRNVYVASGVSASVAVFARVASGAIAQVPGPGGCVSANGSANACSTGIALGGARSVSVAPDGRRVYVAATDQLRGGLGVYARNPANGALTQTGCVSDRVVGCARARAIGQLGDVAVSPDGRTVYTAASATGRGGVAVFRRRD